MQNIKKASLTEGALFSKMLYFAIPIMLTGILQLLYNTADNIVVGRFSGDPNALGAVGSTGSVTSLVINMLMGLSTGASVLVSQFFGAKNDSGVSRASHTALATALIGGVLFGAIGELVASPLLKLLGTKPDLFDSALLYVRIIFLGVPALAVFNFGAAIVRSLGDSRTPLIILASTGLINVALNLLFVICFDMSVDGVALSTIISQYISAAAIVAVLMRADGPHRFSPKKLRIDLGILKRMLRIAIPSAVQSSMFSVSNMILQSSINTFTTDEVSGISVGGTIESFVYIALNSFYTVTLTFVGQNYGAHKPKRTKKIFLYSLVQVTMIGLAVASIITAFIDPISMLFVDPEASNVNTVIEACKRRCSVVLFPYILCGFMESTTGFLRGYGYSLLPMSSAVMSICVIRALWSWFIFPLPKFNTIEGLFIVYPISWLVAALSQGTMVFFVYRKKRRELGPEV